MWFFLTKGAPRPRTAEAQRRRAAHGRVGVVEEGGGVCDEG